MAQREQDSEGDAEQSNRKHSTTTYTLPRASSSPLRCSRRESSFLEQNEDRATSSSPTNNTLAARRQQRIASLFLNPATSTHSGLPPRQDSLPVRYSTQPALSEDPPFRKFDSQLHLRGEPSNMNKGLPSSPLRHVHSPGHTTTSTSTTRQTKEGDLFFTVNDEGEIIIPDDTQFPTASQPISQPPVPQPATPSEGIIVPRLRKSHVSPENRIIIEVGGREFLVCTDIFEESLWFRKAIRRCSIAAPGCPRRIVIENDPDLFAEVLKYLRTGICPLYWDKVKGFDVARYAELANQASVYHIPKLWVWITQEKYLDAVTVTVMRGETKIRRGTQHHQRHVQQANWELSVDAVLEGVDEVWICPKGAPDHDGDSTMCELKGCCGTGGIMDSSAKNFPQQRIKVDVTRIFTSEKRWTVDFAALRP